MDRSFLRHAAIYGLGTLLIHAGGLLLLPIYLHCLKPKEYAILELVNRLAETVGTCLLFGGFKQALFTFYKQANTDADRRRVVTSTFSLVLAAGVLGLCLLFVFGSWLEHFLVSDTEPVDNPHLLLTLAVISILIEPFSLMPLTLIQARVESTFYAIVVVCQFLFRIGLCILLVRVLHWGALGALLATTLTGIVFGLSLTVRELARGLAWPGGEQIRTMLWFALPLLPGGLCFFILHNGDRFFLKQCCSLHEVGLYSLGYKLAMTVRVFSFMPLYMVWSSHMYQVAKQPDSATVFAQMTTRILAAVLFVGLGMALFASEVVLLLGGRDYAAAAAFVGPTLIVCFLQSSVMMMDAGFYLRHRTGVKMVVTFSATIIILILYAWLIPAMGARGAILATIGGFGFLFLATLYTTQRFFYVRYEWGRMGVLVSLAVTLGVVGQNLPLSRWAVVVKGGLVLVGPVLVWNSGLVRREEKHQVHAQLHRLRGLLLKQPLPRHSTGIIPPAESPAEMPPMSYSRSV